MAGLLALVLAAPAGSVAAADSAEASFEATFAPIETAAADFVPAPHAVDVTAIETPVEAQPAARSLGSGTASYYGKKFHGRRTASGERFDMHALTAAHRTLPFGSEVRVTNPRTGRSVVVRINDRGPFHGSRVIDVSHAAASELGLIQRGHGAVELELLK